VTELTNHNNLADSLPQDTQALPKAKSLGSMKQASAEYGVSVALLRAAKAKGCPGFHPSGRINWELVGPWIQEHTEELQVCETDNKDYWAVEKLKWDAQRSKLAYEQQQGLYLSKQDVALQLNAIAAATKGILLSELEQSLPAKLVGLGEIQIRETMRQTVDTLCANIQRGVAPWTQ
jgi:hypothetical protein